MVQFFLSKSTDSSNQSQEYAWEEMLINSAFENGRQILSVSVVAYNSI